MTRFAKAHHIKSLRTNGYDLNNVDKKSKYAISEIKKNRRPFFIQFDNYRFLEHCGPNDDDYKNYRPISEQELWKSKDPVKLLYNELIRKKLLNKKQLVNIEEKIQVNIDKMFKRSISAPLPKPSEAKIIYMHKKNVAQVIRETIFYCMKKDKDIILFGEGIDDNAAMFNTTSGTTKAFGKNRVFEMPLSENCIVGAAIGASIEGDKVIINFQRVEFALLALEQIINNAAKTSYITSAKHNVPIVIRLVIGKGWGQGPVHSQSLEGLFTSIPGLKVMMPVFPNETKNLLFEAINDPNPVIFIENRWCHYLYGNIDKKYKRRIAL